MRGIVEARGTLHVESEVAAAHLPHSLRWERALVAATGA